jgi:T5orf172 domain
MADPGCIYIKITDVTPECRSVAGVERLIGLVKLGKTNDLDRRDAEYKIYLPMLFHTVFAVRVDDRHIAEQLILEHFRPHNVRSEFGPSARQTMSPELARVARMVGVECFRIEPEAAKAVLLVIGDPVADERLAA